MDVDTAKTSKCKTVLLQRISRNSNCRRISEAFHPHTQ
jgi:hypothetical protein